MKKLFVCLMLGAFLVGSVQTVEAYDGRGGVGGLLTGCFFGIRTAGAWNEGKDLHWREWGRLIPFVNIALAVWDGVEGAQGITTRDLAAQYGSNFY